MPRCTLRAHRVENGFAEQDLGGQADTKLQSILTAKVATGILGCIETSISSRSRRG